MTFTVEEVLRATGGRLIQGRGEGILFRGVSTDSRTLLEEELFIALRGTRFNGHDFALEALKKRASGVIVEEERVKEIQWNGDPSKVVIAVKDTLQALGDLARERRRKYRTPVVGITGSNGKTTTKEMMAACLKTTFPVLKTEGNLNNLIGLPLTLLKLTEKERVVVLEMGMNVPGEIRRLTEIAEPDVALITNIHPVHLEGMKDIEKIKEEKGELFRRMRQDGSILVNQDDPRVVDLAQTFLGQKISYGIENPSDVRAKEIRLTKDGTYFYVTMEGEGMEIHLPLLGKHFVLNALSAIAGATLFGISLEKAKEALEQFPPYPMRMQYREIGGGVHLLNDTYNANPRSMELALETVTEIKGKGRAIAVLGDMLELGAFSEEAHRWIGRRVSELNIDFLLVLGEKVKLLIDSALRHGMKLEKTYMAKDHEDAIHWLDQTIREGDWVLVKGSRGMTMERIVEGLIQRRR
jgi:UDP-N-acetylmuramoyl-tripeptide--D-alanyl-D-alanine ligase